MGLHNADYRTLRWWAPRGETTVNGISVKRFGVLVSVMVLTGCPDEKPIADAGNAIDAGPAVDAGVVDAGPPVPTELTFAIDFLGLDGGVSTVQSTATTAQIHPSQSVFIQFPTPLKDYRVRMFDGAEQVLPSDEEARAEDGGLSYRIVLAEPLKPGRSYSFSIEAELGHEITDVSGRGYRDVRVALKVLGEPEPEPKKKPAKKRRK
jgi:hypothetical protein